MLAVFNIEKAVDGNGMPITPVAEYTSNIIRQVTSGLAHGQRISNQVPTQAPETLQVQDHPPFTGGSRRNSSDGIVH